MFVLDVCVMCVVCLPSVHMEFCIAVTSDVVFGRAATGPEDGQNRCSAPDEGLEPSTTGLKVLRSTKLS